mmetsp:Transcript_21245/g.51891  ORF Transcript_21245/g.51891 Transcript_21245/m.51891 type:complete len:325 (+) Transcript_21245:512-1486(+)
MNACLSVPKSMRTDLHMHTHTHMQSAGCVSHMVLPLPTRISKQSKDAKHSGGRADTKSCVPLPLHSRVLTQHAHDRHAETNPHVMTIQTRNPTLPKQQKRRRQESSLPLGISPCLPIVPSSRGRWSPVEMIKRGLPFCLPSSPLIDPLTHCWFYLFAVGLCVLQLCDGLRQPLDAHLDVLGAVVGETQPQIRTEALSERSARQESRLVLDGNIQQVRRQHTLRQFDKDEVAALGHLVRHASWHVLVQCRHEYVTPPVQFFLHVGQVLLLQSQVDRLVHDAADHRIDAPAGVELSAVDDGFEYLHGPLHPPQPQGGRQDLRKRPQ